MFRAPRLLLFDIDGTLLLTRGKGRMLLRRAFEEVLDRTVDIDGVSFSGRTDPAIARDIAQLNGINGNDCALTTQTVLARYADIWDAEWDAVDAYALPGVDHLIPHLFGAPGVHLGLVTGNLQPVAYNKLRCIGMTRYFADGLGAFGSDSSDRDHLPAIAVERVTRHTGSPFATTDVFVIGDTPSDIRCGRSISATTIGVCTGYFDRDSLETAGADVVLDSLEDVAAAFSILTESA